MTLGESIQKLRKRNDLSQEQLAGLLHVSRQSISKWEADISIPEFDKLKSLCGIFHVSMDELVYGKENEEQAALEEKVAFLQDCISELQMKKPITKRLKCLCIAVLIIAVISVFSISSKIRNISYELDNVRNQIASLQVADNASQIQSELETDFIYENLDVENMKVDQTLHITLHEQKKDTKIWFVYKIGEETTSVEAEEIEDMVYEVTQKLPIEKNVRITYKQESDGIKTSEVILDSNIKDECSTMMSLDTKNSSIFKKDGKEFIKTKAYFLDSMFSMNEDNGIKGTLTLDTNENTEDIGEYKLPKAKEKKGILYHELDIELPLDKIKGKSFQLTYHDEMSGNDYNTQVSYKYKDGELH